MKSSKFKNKTIKWRSGHEYVEVRVRCIRCTTLNSCVVLYLVYQVLSVCLRLHVCCVWCMLYVVRPANSCIRWSIGHGLSPSCHAVRRFCFFFVFCSNGIQRIESVPTLLLLLRTKLFDPPGCIFVDSIARSSAVSHLCRHYRTLVGSIAFRWSIEPSSVASDLRR